MISFFRSAPIKDDAAQRLDLHDSIVCKTLETIQIIVGGEPKIKDVRGRVEIEDVLERAVERSLYEQFLQPHLQAQKSTRNALSQNQAQMSRLIETLADSAISGDWGAIRNARATTLRRRRDGAKTFAAIGDLAARHRRHQRVTPHHMVAPKIHSCRFVRCRIGLKYHGEFDNFRDGAAVDFNPLAS